MAESIVKSHTPFDRKSAQWPAGDQGHFRLINTKDRCGPRLRQSPPGNHLIDRHREADFRELLFSIGVAEVGVDVAAPRNHSYIFHRCYPFDRDVPGDFGMTQKSGLPIGSPLFCQCRLDVNRVAEQGVGGFAEHF